MPKLPQSLRFEPDVSQILSSCSCFEQHNISEVKTLLVVFLFLYHKHHTFLQHLASVFEPLILCLEIWGLFLALMDSARGKAHCTKHALDL